MAGDLRIIDDATWNQAQERLSALRQIYGQKPHQGRRGPKTHYTVTYPRSIPGGLVYCGTCGARLAYQTGGTDVYFGCPNHRRGLCEQVVRVPQHKGEESILRFSQEELTRQPEWVPWGKIGEITGLGRGNAHAAWRRRHDAQEQEGAAQTPLHTSTSSASP